jgi:hypothetical protein
MPEGQHTTCSGSKHLQSPVEQSGRVGSVTWDDVPHPSAEPHASLYGSPEHASGINPPTSKSTATDNHLATMKASRSAPILKN